MRYVYTGSGTRKWGCANALAGKELKLVASCSRHAPISQMNNFGMCGTKVVIGRVGTSYDTSGECSRLF